MSSTIPIFTQIEKASFSIWSKDAIKEISVKKITEPKSFEKAGALHPDGLYSLSLGPIKRFEVCTTCGLTDLSCPGHYGHIEISVPVFHPMLVQTIHQILNMSCLECSHFRLSQSMLKLFLAQLEALDCGFDHLIQELNDIAVDMCGDNKDKDNYLHVKLGQILLARIEEEKEKNPELDCKNRPQLRSVVERLSKLFRSFINGQLIKPSKICPHCGEKKTSIALHQQSVLVIGANSSKPINNLEDKVIEASPKSSKESKRKKFKRDHSREKGDLKFLRTDEKKFLTPIGVRDCFRRLWKNERRNLERIFHFLNIDCGSVDKEEEEIEDEVWQEDIRGGYIGDSVYSKEKSPLDNQFQPVDLFFIDTILVPPPKFRPPMSQRGHSFEGPRTAALSNVMKQSIVIQDTLDKMLNEPDEVQAEMLEIKVQKQWHSLQVAVNSLYDNEMDKYGKTKYPGLKQLIDKKEGLFRKNMMGKRVNFAARSVISPDPNISVDQIGVPLVFAMKLTYPEPVTPWNIQQLKQAVLNGPNKYPGATSVVYDDDFTVSLIKESTRMQVAERLSYKPFNRSKKNQDTHKSTIVNRHLRSGDMLLFNRQPTLHKPSIMAFRARVLPGERGFRLHYANCKSFNADFDGDEMNAHLPQSELARSEACNITSVNYQYLVPKDGSPLSGLIQDHVVALCILTDRDQFLDAGRYNQLVYCALASMGKPIKLEHPTIIRPKELWTGKQVITTLIKNCIPDGKPAPCLDIKSKIGPKILNIKPEYVELSDCHVIIRNGELLVGFIDKSNVGATQYGLVHSCYELYGGQTSSALLSAFARLATWYLQLYEGFTLGIADILVDEDANNDRQKLIQESRGVGPDSAKEALGISSKRVTEEELVARLREAHSDRSSLQMKKLDAAMKIRTDKFASNISSRCLPEGLIRKFPENNLQMMIQSGAKGGTVNALQISCLLGQIELEGRRVPLSMSGRTLPSFEPYDTSPKAGGFVTGRFLTGIQPQEFFFHCMAGREGLIDTAVKTSRSGYLQRCLTKHLEGLTVQYDQTVRDSCGSVIQFLYGEDGLDIVKSQMLKSKAFSLLVNNYKILSPTQNEIEMIAKAKEEYEEEVISSTNDLQQWLDEHGDNRVKKMRGSGFLDFLEKRLADIAAEKEQEVKDIKSIGSQHHDQIFRDWYALSFKDKKKWNRSWRLCPDPLTSLMNPASHYGVVTEKLDQLIGEFVRENPQLVINPASLLGETSLDSCMAYNDNPELSRSLMHWNKSTAKLTNHEFYNLCYSLYMKMLAQPGEAVGLLAAQSIGEPSTQMTLNTFHFAGRGEMNVTLGIPRLREILMTASAKIGTPSMDIPIIPVMKGDSSYEIDEQATDEQAQRIKLALNAVRLSDVLEYVEITEQMTDQDFALGERSALKSRKKRLSKAEKCRAIEYQITFVLLPAKFYKHEFKTKSKKVMKFMEDVFIPHLIDAMVKRQKRLLVAEEMFDLSSKKTRKSGIQSTVKATEGEDDQEEKDLDAFNAKIKEKVEDESSSEDDEDGEGDTTTAKLKNRRDADLDYEEPEEDDLVVGDVEAIAAAVEEDEREILTGDDDITAAPLTADDDLELASKGNGNIVEPPTKEAKMDPSLLSGLMAKCNPYLKSYECHSKRKRWCKITVHLNETTTRLDMGAIIDYEAKRTYVHRVGNIQRALIVKDAKNRKMIKTEGVSLLSLVRFDQILDLNAVYTNDIHAVANTYGIEAASQAIRCEMANVFAVYGIVVDPRHLSLIADYMTYNGTIRGMNRMSMEASASPFQQMSFESTLRYLKWAAILGLYDDIKSPSASLVFGRPTRGGTGLFALQADPEPMQSRRKFSRLPNK